MGEQMTTCMNCGGHKEDASTFIGRRCTCEKEVKNAVVVQIVVGGKDGKRNGRRSRVT